MDYAGLDNLRAELAAAPEHWQFGLLGPHDLALFAKDRGINIWNGETVENLWCAGLLRADIVRSAKPVDVNGLKLIEGGAGGFVYCDLRAVPHRPEGYGGIFQAVKGRPEVELIFHPFRLHVLYHVDRVFQSDGVSTQYLLHPEGLVSIAKLGWDHLDRWSKTEKCAERFEYWNRTSELAAVLEPAAYGRIFHSVSWGHADSEESIRSKLSSHRDCVRGFLAGVSAEEIGKFRQDLCVSAEVLDGNKMTHVLLRLTLARERLKLKSSLGASMFFLAMSEVIRRAAEEAHGRDYPEEDELGFGQWMEGARKSIYGSERIIDAPAEVRRDFLTSMGLDAGVKVRVYTEGATEFGALESAAGAGAGVELINLRGQVLESKGRGLAFADSLKSDMASRTFSVVLLDGDTEDNVRALKKAAMDGAFFGRFFIASPDFEFDNFTVSELLEAALDLATQAGDGAPPESDFTDALATTSADEFFGALKRAGVRNVYKSAGWGKGLMAYAVRHPKFPEGHVRSGEVRPVVEAARLIINARRAGYTRSLNQFEVDPDTGKLRERVTAKDSQ